MLWVAGEAVVGRVWFFRGPCALGGFGVDFFQGVDVLGMCVDLLEALILATVYSAKDKLSSSYRGQH